MIVLFLPTRVLLAAEVDFNTDIMANRGISTNLAHYFSEAQRYTPGQHAANVKINGIDKGTLAIRVGEDGQLCADRDFTSAVGLLPLTPGKTDKCHNLLQDYPTATISLFPNTESLELFVPAEAIDNGFYAANNYSHGGIAGLINYSAFTNYSQYGSAGSSTYSQGNIETGINLSNWTLRSHYILTDDNGKRNADNLYNYAEHVFEEEKVRAQVGEINANSALFSGAQITGVQFMPETGLQADIPVTSISGLANSNQARVEVRQSGQVIYSTLVNAGPFTLNDVPIVRSNSDLDVSVVESNGSTTHFVIPATSLKLSGMTRAEGLSVSLGRVREEGEDSPWVMNVSDGKRLSAQISAIAASVLAEKYQSAGAMLEWSINDNWQLSPSLLLSRAQYYEKQQGNKAELQSTLILPAQISLSLSVSQYSEGYRELSEAMQEDAQSNSNAWSGSLTWSNDIAGSVSVQYSANASSEGSNGSRYVMASWNKTLKQVSLSLNWQHAMNNSQEDNNSGDGDTFYANLIIPFGEQRISTYTRSQGHKQSYGIQNSGNLSTNVSYNLSADRDNDSSNSFNGNINANLHYTQLGLSAGQSDRNQHNYSAALSGGTAIHRHGLTFTPYAIKETFGIARLSEPESGIEINTPGGTVWTDKWGQAVVPGLREWQKSQIVINTNSLPQGMDLANGIQTVSAAYGSFEQVEFNVLNTRRVMLTIKRPNGSWLERGLSVVDKDGNYIVSVMDDGSVFIPDATEMPDLYVVDESLEKVCQIHYSLSEEKNKDAYYEKAEGMCQ